VSGVLSTDAYSQVLETWKKSPMKRPKIAKVTVNVSLGYSGERLQKVAEFLESYTGQKPVYRKAKRTIRAFGVRKGESIAVMVTLRKDKALEFLDKALEAVARKLKASSIDKHGNISFGIEEHISLPGVKYDPELGIIGMDVIITIEKPGYRIVRRKRNRKRNIPLCHRVKPEETMVLLSEMLNVQWI